MKSLSNLELMALNITAEFCSIDPECQLFREIKGSQLEVCKLSRTNRSTICQERIETAPNTRPLQDKLLYKQL